jgi:uncharacterized repeat protein (TIGR03803 family)
MRIVTSSVWSDFTSYTPATAVNLIKIIAAACLLTIAAVATSPAQSFTMLVNFDFTNGASPEAALIQGTDGNLYGTTTEGASDSGTFFKMTPSGTLTTLTTFNVLDNGSPYGGLVQASNGYFYGTTSGGGINNEGTVFDVTTTGVLTTIASFDGTDGYGGPLLLASDGNFYGASVAGGANNSCQYGCGTVCALAVPFSLHAVTLGIATVRRVQCAEETNQGNGGNGDLIA